MQRKNALVFGAAALLAAATTAQLFAQDLHPSRRKSPVGTVRAHIDDAYVLIAYGQPYKRDREHIFGTKQKDA